MLFHSRGHQNQYDHQMAPGFISEHSGGTFGDVLGSWDGPEQLVGDIGQPGGAFCGQMGVQVENLVSFSGSWANIWEALASQFL